MLRIAVCDDDVVMLSKIVRAIEHNLELNGLVDYEIKTFISGLELLSLEKDISDFNIIFLDINMEELNGLELAKCIREYDSDVFIVFVTAFIDYAPEGYKYDAIRFILKDMLDEMLKECIETIIKRMKIKTGKIQLDFLEGKKEVPIEKIRFIESRKHKLFFDIKPDGQLSLYGKLDNMEEKLREYHFLRIHKSYLVNLRHIESIIAYKAQLYGGINLPIPRSKYKGVKDRFYEYRSEMI